MKSKKQIIASIFEYIRITDLFFLILSKKYKNDYIRVVNYHHTPAIEMDNFERQLEWYSKHFRFITYREFDDYMNGRISFEKPGIILTFDDGYSDNYLTAKEILPKYGAEGAGWYMISSRMIGKDGYMDAPQIKELDELGHTICCHTATHHRMNENDLDGLLKEEIVESKTELEKILNRECAVFCWCGGEEEYYTQSAEKFIECAGYRYSFMTNSQPVTSNTNCFRIQRSNIETCDSISLVKFQICGLMDLKYHFKRKRVDRKISIE